MVKSSTFFTKNATICLHMVFFERKGSTIEEIKIKLAIYQHQHVAELRTLMAASDPLFLAWKHLFVVNALEFASATLSHQFLSGVRICPLPSMSMHQNSPSSYLNDETLTTH